jgi:acyl-CoA synthetase (AMP-forming)/AMP-acid ligase II
MRSAPTTLADLVRLHARERQHALAFVCEGRRTTFEEFDRNTSRVANGLIAAGITGQARFAYLSRNSEHVFEMLYGASKARAVAVGVNWRLSRDEAAYILRDSETRLLFTDAATLPLARAAAAECPLISRIVMIDPPNGEPACGYLHWRDAQSDSDPALPVGATDVACQLYTSGTTGRPKGVLLTHRNFMEQRAAAADSGPWMNAEEGSVALVVMPTYHVGGLTMGTIAFHQGATTVVSKNPDPDDLIDTIERHRVTQLFLVPAVIQSLLDRCDGRRKPMQSLRVLRYGAAPISAALLRQARAILSCDLLQVYGMTEATGTVTCLPPVDHCDPDGGGRMRSCGKPLAHVEVRIMDAQGNRVQPGTVGEICIRAGSVMAGYWKQPQATAEAFFGDWYRSGDAGCLDEAGYVYLRDRIKDLIISGGENIYPAEVENAICEHQAVLEAAVIGVPDSHWGEAVKAVVVMKSGKAVSQADLIHFIRARIAGFKVPKSIDFVAQLPRNPSGKILRRELRLPYWSGRESQI